MTELYGIKTGTPSVCANLLRDVLEVRFRRFGRGSSDEWFVARSRDEREVLVLFANRDDNGRAMEASAPDYELLLYVAATPRPQDIARRLASETSFRFLEVSDRLRAAVATNLRSFDSKKSPHDAS